MEQDTRADTPGGSHPRQVKTSVGHHDAPVDDDHVDDDPVDDDHVDDVEVVAAEGRDVPGPVLPADVGLHRDGC